MYEVMNQVSGKSVFNSRIEREKGQGKEGPISYGCSCDVSVLYSKERMMIQICDRLYRIVYNGGCYNMI